MIIDAMIGYILQGSIVVTGTVITAANYEGIQPNKSLPRNWVSELIRFPCAPAPMHFPPLLVLQ
jgi:hypothetical protein